MNKTFVNKRAFPNKWNPQKISGQSRENCVYGLGGFRKASRALFCRITKTPLRYLNERPRTHPIRTHPKADSGSVFLVSLPFSPRSSFFAVSYRQEPRKGGFSKGGFCRVQCHGQGNKKYPRTLAPAGHLALRAPQPREAYVLQKPLKKKTFSWFLISLPKILLSGPKL